MKLQVTKVVSTQEPKKLSKGGTVYGWVVNGFIDGHPVDEVKVLTFSHTIDDEFGAGWSGEVTYNEKFRDYRIATPKKEQFSQSNSQPSNGQSRSIHTFMETVNRYKKCLDAAVFVTGVKVTHETLSPLASVAATLFIECNKNNVYIPAEKKSEKKSEEKKDLVWMVKETLAAEDIDYDAPYEVIRKMLDENNNSIEAVINLIKQEAEGEELPF